VRPGHLGSLAEPAVVVGAFADPLEEHRGAPMAVLIWAAVLAMEFLLLSMHDFLGGGGGSPRCRGSWRTSIVCMVATFCNPLVVYIGFWGFLFGTINLPQSTQHQENGLCARFAMSRDFWGKT